MFDKSIEQLTADLAVLAKKDEALRAERAALGQEMQTIRQRILFLSDGFRVGSIVESKKGGVYKIFSINTNTAYVRMRGFLRLKDGVSFSKRLYPLYATEIAKVLEN